MSSVWQIVQDAAGKPLGADPFVKPRVQMLAKLGQAARLRQCVEAVGLPPGA